MSTKTKKELLNEVERLVSIIKINEGELEIFKGAYVPKSDYDVLKIKYDILVTARKEDSEKVKNSEAVLSNFQQREKDLITLYSNRENSIIESFKNQRNLMVKDLNRQSDGMVRLFNMMDVTLKTNLDIQKANYEMQQTYYEAFKGVFVESVVEEEPQPQVQPEEPNKNDIKYEEEHN